VIRKRRRCPNPAKIKKCDDILQKLLLRPYEEVFLASSKKWLTYLLINC